MDDIRNREAIEAAERVADYDAGFVTDIETEFAPKGLNEDTVRYISAKKGEPEWLLDWRLKAFRAWLRMEARSCCSVVIIIKDCKGYKVKGIKVIIQSTSK